MNENYGYRIDLENREQLQAICSPMLLKSGEFNEPERIDPRPILITEDQGSMGACQGHALSTCLEWCHYVATRGQYLQLSRLFAYLGSQKIDGINGDSGSTLQGGAKLATQYGICPEAQYPYPRPVAYPRGGWRSIPENLWAAAEPYKIKSVTWIEQEAEVKTFLAAGAGLVEIGIAWGGAMTPNSQGIISRFAPGGGGHAVVIGGYVPDAAVGKATEQGYYYLLHNSWSKRWGMDGWAYVTPTAVRQMLQHRFTYFMGLSDMEAIRPRDVDFIKESVIQ